MPLGLTRLFAALATLCLTLAPLGARAQNSYGGLAPNFYVLDVGTGQVLAEQNADIPLPPASMSKLMTLAVLFDALAEGRVALDTTWRVSQRAYAMGGSRMFLETRDRPTTEDLIRGIAVVSGNDASVVVAEGLGGTEEAFAEIAQRRAEQLGMTNTTIANSSGWPDPRHRFSLHDLGTLALYLVRDHAQFYPYLGEAEFTWNGITQPNRVPLLGAGLGVDGLKTGHTEEAGYALVGSATQGDRRIVFVFSGLQSSADRTRETEAIVAWAFRQFVQRDLFGAGDTVTEARVWMGAQETVPLTATEDARLLMPVLAPGEITAHAEYDSPLAAPLIAGTVVGRLVLSVDGQERAAVPLAVGADVAEGGMVTRLLSAATILGGQLGLTQP